MAPLPDDEEGEITSIDGEYINVTLDSGIVIERYRNELEEI